MTTEIAVFRNDEFSFNSYELKVKTNQIFTALRENNKNSLKIAGLLSVVRENNLFMDDFESFEAYAQQVFGLKKAQAYNLSNIGRFWVARDEKGKVLPESVLPHEKNCDWTTTKLLALEQADVSYTDAVRLCESEVINASMSVSALKAALKEWKALKAGPQEADADEPEEADAQEQEETDANEPNEKENAESLYSHFLNLVTAASQNSAGIYNEAFEKGLINDENKASWLSAMSYITQGYNALLALLNIM